MIQNSINSLAAAFAGAAFKKELLKAPEERADYKKAQKELDKQWTDPNFVGPPAVSHKAQGKGGTTINVKASEKAQNAWNENNKDYASKHFGENLGDNFIQDVVYHDPDVRALKGLQDSIWQKKRGRTSADVINKREEAARKFLGMQAQGEFASYKSIDLGVISPGEGRDGLAKLNDFYKGMKSVGNENFNKTLEAVEEKITAPSKGKYDQYGTLIRDEVKK